MLVLVLSMQDTLCDGMKGAWQFRVRDFDYFLAASAAKNCGKKAVIQSAARWASTQGGCASSRLDHGLKFYVIRGGCAGSRLINEFSDCVQTCPEARPSLSETSESIPHAASRY